jgi:hypothetical protein
MFKWIFIEIDNINTPYSNNDVYLTIKYILKPNLRHLKDGLEYRI